MKLYDSLTRRKNELVEKEINIYSCGPTVYNHIHLGNARPLILMDTLTRYLKNQGFKPKWVQNITDIDDKIINQALATNQSESAIADKYLASYLADLKKLNISQPTAMPLISNHIPEMIAYIQKLINLGFAYQSEGDVFFKVGKLKSNYGKLSKQNIEQLQSETNLNHKKSNLDFALWKKTHQGKTWDSPWGPGRPGWHTECVVLINSVFKNQPLDIHAGGIDLQFPHHENERAQHLAITKKELAKIWLHNGHLTFDNQKMSKSQGNVVLVRDFLKLHNPNLLRWIFLSSNYRQPINFTSDLLNQGSVFFTKINNLRKKMIYHFQIGSEPQQSKINQMTEAIAEQFSKVMDDNLNTPQVLSLIEALIAKANQALKKNQFTLAQQKYYDLKRLLEILGFEVQLQTRLSAIDAKTYQKWLNLISDKNFEQADYYRAKLKAKDLI